MIPAEVRRSPEALKSYCFSYIEDNDSFIQDRDILVALHSLGYNWNWDEKLLRISNIRSTPASSSSIISIEDVDNVETMDLSIEKTHSYVANGIVSHNTYNLPSDYTLTDYVHLILAATKEHLVGFTSFNPKGSLAPILTLSSPKAEAKK